MSNFNKKVLGTAAGAVGDVVFKTRYGRTYICSRPASFKKSNSEGSVKAREKFRFCQMLFAAMGRVYWFKQFWNAAEIDGDTFINKMFKVNYERISEGLDFTKVRLLPVEDGFNAEVISHSLENKIFTIKVSPLGSDSGIKTNKKVSMQGVMLLSERLDETDKPYEFISFESEEVIAVEGEELTFTAELIGEEYAGLLKYSKRFFVANLITKNKVGKPQNVSINLFG